MLTPFVYMFPRFVVVFCLFFCECLLISPPLPFPRVAADGRNSPKPPASMAVGCLIYQKSC